MHNKTLCCFFFFFSVYLFSYSFCIHYHPPLCILTCHYCFLLMKDDLLLSFFYTLSEGKRIFIYMVHITNDVVVNVFFFCIVVALPLSLSLCRFLPASFRTREKYNKPAQRVDKLFYAECVFFLLRVRIFFLYILSIFPFFTSLCNRQMKVEKKNPLNTYVVSRTMRPSVTIESSTTFRLFSLFFLYLSYFFALSSLTA
jgi:hypothetical protein